MDYAQNVLKEEALADRIQNVAEGFIRHSIAERDKIKLAFVVTVTKKRVE